MMIKKNRIRIIKSVTVSVLSLLISAESALAAQSFNDVNETHLHYQAIEFLKNEGIINGYADGSFKPEQVVNRAEALKIILNAKGIETPEIVQSSFSDVNSTDWFAKYVEAAKNKGIVGGNPDGTFAPDRTVNKVEFLKMLLLAYEVKFINYQTPEKPLYSDTPDSSQWYIPYLDFAKNVNLIQPNAAGQIEPAKGLSRGEVAEITYKLLIIVKGGPTQLLLSRAEALLMQSIYDLQNADISSAKANIAAAKDLAMQALESAPEAAVVKAAVKVIAAFEALINAFDASSQNNYEETLKQAGTAYNLAEEAKNISPSVENLAAQVKSAAQSLADATRAKQTNQT